MVEGPCAPSGALSHPTSPALTCAAQPYDDPYKPHTCEELLKWKFAHMNSVDFKLKCTMQGGKVRVRLVALCGHSPRRWAPRTMALTALVCVSCADCQLPLHQGTAPCSNQYRVPPSLTRTSAGGQRPGHGLPAVRDEHGARPGPGRAPRPGAAARGARLLPPGPAAGQWGPPALAGQGGWACTPLVTCMCCAVCWDKAEQVIEEPSAACCWCCQRCPALALSTALQCI